MSKVTIEVIQKLRERTGIGMMDCKKALTETSGNIEKAIELLRKKGAKVAEKRGGMETAEGVISTYIHPGAHLGVIVEINCETDFSANTDEMKQFGYDLCMQIAASNPLYVDVDDVRPELVEKEKEIIREQLKASGKPEQIIEKIMDNKVEKYYETICLLRQKYIKDDSLTIQDRLNDLRAKIGENIKIKRFTRYQLGE